MDGCYDSESKSINIDNREQSSNELVQQVIIIHELLHALSYSKETNDDITTKKIGLQIIQTSQDKFVRDMKWIYNSDETFRSFGRGINEGLTQLLTEQILGLGTNFNIALGTEKDITRILKALFGEEYLMEKYFQPIKSEEKIKEPIEYIFGQRLESELMYGEHQKYKELEQVLLNFEILEALNYNSNGIMQDDQRKYYTKIKGNIEFSLKELAKFTLELTAEDEIDEKIENLLKAFRDYHGDGMNYSINNNLIFHFSNHKTANAIQKIIIDEQSGMQLGQMVHTYFRLTKPKESWSARNAGYTEWQHSVEDYCIKKGIIADSEAKKSGMLSLILMHYRSNLRNMTDDDFKKFLLQFSYTKLGSHYELSYSGDNSTISGGTQGVLFNKDGDISLTYGMFPHVDGWSCNEPPIDYEYDVEKAERIKAQVENIAKNSERRISRALVSGDDVFLYYDNIDDRIVYSLNENGELVLSETGTLRRIIDDMSEVDIKLQQETSNVSITEMMKETDAMKMILGDKTPKTNEYLIEDDRKDK